jgi:diguanylate cyclase (GGDEF)-like protein
VSVDLSDFKLVNSVCGIEKGDEVIKRVWEIISTNVTDREFAAHGGGDHFVMYLQEVYQSHLLERLQQITEEVEAVSEELGIISIHPYFGIYEMRDIVDPEEAYNYANQAKKEVKGDKIKNVAFYDEINFKKIMDNKALVDSFKSAIEKEEFQIWYQPKFCGNTAKIVGAEALVRWRKSDGTVVSPGQFIPLFESNGMIITLDQYVFSKVCEQQKRWEREGVKIIPISVNISRASLYWGNIVNKYRDIARNYDIDLKMVPLEITESATIKNSQVKELVEKFRDAGFVLCLDDFGNGYSSLAMLNLIRFDVLKLDKALVDYIGDAHGEQLVKYTIRVAQGMGMHAVAEGVETLEQVEFLNAQGCDEIQGYFFSKPVALEKFTSMLVI